MNLKVSTICLLYLSWAMGKLRSSFVAIQDKSGNQSACYQAFQVTDLRMFKIIPIKEIHPDQVFSSRCETLSDILPSLPAAPTTEVKLPFI